MDASREANERVQMGVPFAQMPLKASSKRALREAGFESPTSLQAAAIPAIARGDSTLVIGEAASGRTVALAVGLFDRINDSSDRIQALVLAPTRQSVQKMVETMRKLAASTSIRIHSCVGGTLSVGEELRLLAERKPHVIVGLPGRVNVLLGRDAFAVDHIRLLVLYHVNEAAWQTLQDQSKKIIDRLRAGGQFVADKLEGHESCFKQLFDHPPPSFFVVAKDEKNGTYTVVRAEDHVLAQRAQRRASNSAASSSNQTAEDPDFSLISNWNRPASWAQAGVSAGIEKILASFGSTRPRPKTLQTQLLTPALDRMDVLGITPPGSDTALALALVATERVAPRTSGLQVLVVEPWPPSDLEHLVFAFGRPSGIGVDRCECCSDEECDHPAGCQQILVHSPTADTRTTVAERAMRIPDLTLVVLHRVDALLAADRPKIFALLRAKPKHVQLVITTTEMTADVLRIARDFMPLRTVKDDRSPAVISMTEEGMQVASYSLVNGRLESKVHMDAPTLGETVRLVYARRFGAMFKVPTEMRDVSRLPPFDSDRFFRADIVWGMQQAGIRLRDEQKAHLLACMGDLPNALLRGPPGSGKSTTAALVVLRVLPPPYSAPALDVVILVPSVKRAQKFKSLLETLGKAAMLLIYVCGQSVNALPSPPPSIVIGKPRQIRQLIASGQIDTASLKLVVFSQVHEMLGAAYREESREVLRSLPVFVQLLATSNAQDAAVVQEIDEFFNADLRLRDDRAAATQALGQFAEQRLSRYGSAFAHVTLKEIIENLDELCASDQKIGDEPMLEAETSKSKEEQDTAAENDAAQSASAAASESATRTHAEQPANSSPIEQPPRVAHARLQSVFLVPEERSQEEWDRTHGCFADFGLKIPLVLALFQSGLSIPRPLQQRALAALLKKENLVIEERQGAGKTTAVMIALLNQLDPVKNGLQAICLTRTAEEVLRIRDSMATVLSKLKLRVGTCTYNQALQRPELDCPNAHVLIGFGDHIHSCIQHHLLTFHSVRHLVAFHTGVEPKPEPGESAFEWGVHLLQLCLPGHAQTVLVIERVTEEVLRLCNKLEGDFSLVAMPEVDEDGQENPTGSQSRQNSQDSADNNNFVHVQLPPPSSTDEEHLQPLPIASTSTAPVVPLASFSIRSSSHSPPTDPGSFGEFNLRPELLDALKKHGIFTMSPFERRVLHAILDGRNVVVRAPAGSFVFLLSLLQRLDITVERVQAIVVCHKRESVPQIELELKGVYGEHTNFSMLTCVGGPSEDQLQLQAIQSGVHVLLGTLQRVQAIVESEPFDRQSLQLVVFDDIKCCGRNMVHSILRRLPPNVQVVFMGREESERVDQTAREFLKDPLFLPDVAPLSNAEDANEPEAAISDAALRNKEVQETKAKIRDLLRGSSHPPPGAMRVSRSKKSSGERVEFSEWINADFSLINTLDGKEMQGEASDSHSRSEDDEQSGADPDTAEVPSTTAIVNESPLLPVKASASPVGNRTCSTRIPRCSFDKFNLRPEVRAALKELNLPRTVAIQRRALPPLLAGRNAVVRAPAGLGTMSVYTIPLLQRLDTSVERVQAIVVCHKRSDVAEIEDALWNGYGRCLDFKARVCVGGELVADQLQAISDGVQVVIGTAQRMQAILESAEFDNRSLSFVAFDDIEELLRTEHTRVHSILHRLPPNAQVVFMGREESEAVDRTARKFLSNPLFISKEGETDEPNAKGSGHQTNGDEQATGGNSNGVPVLPEPSSTSPSVEELLESPSIAPPNSSARGSGRSTLSNCYSFEQFNLRPEILAAIKQMAIRAALLIHRRAIPRILAGRNAVVRAPAGYQTLGVYMIPLLERLDVAVKRVQAIVVCEKQATAEKIGDALVKGYGQCMCFSSHVCSDDEPLADQLRTIGSGVQALIGTLQRMQAIVASSQFDKQALNFVVFDEAEEQVRARCVTLHVLLQRLPPNAQVVFMTRGESEAVNRTAREFLKNPLFISKEGEMDESKSFERSEPSPGAREERESSIKPSSEESTSLSPSSNGTLVVVDSRRTTTRLENGDDDEQPGAKGAERVDGWSQTVKLEELQAPARRESPAETIAAQLAAAQLRGQLLENRLKELEIYELEEKLGLAHGQPVDVLPPN